MSAEDHPAGETESTGEDSARGISRKKFILGSAAAGAALGLGGSAGAAAAAGSDRPATARTTGPSDEELILHNGKIRTMDDGFSPHALIWGAVTSVVNSTTLQVRLMFPYFTFANSPVVFWRPDDSANLGRCHRDASSAAPVLDGLRRHLDDDPRPALQRHTSGDRVLGGGLSLLLLSRDRHSSDSFAAQYRRCRSLVAWSSISRPLLAPRTP